MPTATITSKGQLTLPASVRAEIGVTAGDRIDFVLNGEGSYVLIPKSRSIKALKGIVPKPEKPVSLLDMQDAIIEGALSDRR